MSQMTAQSPKMHSNVITQSSIILSLAFLCGCGITDSARQLNMQNVGAAETIISMTDEPALLQAANDIKANSLALAEELGAPDEPKPYTPETSAAARKTHREELARKLSWMGVLDVVLTVGEGLVCEIPGGNLIVGLLSALGIGGIAAAGMRKGKGNGVA
jgi:hypothetical protein